MRMNISILAILLSVVVERKNYRSVNGQFSRESYGFGGPGSTWGYGESGRRDSESSSPFWILFPGFLVYGSSYSGGHPPSESVGGVDSVGSSDPSSWIEPDESIIYTGPDDYGYEVSGLPSMERGDLFEMSVGVGGNLDYPLSFQPDGSMSSPGQDNSVYDGSSSAGSMGGLASTDMSDGSGGNSNSSLGVQPDGSMSSPRQDDSGNGSSLIFGSMGESSSGMSGGGVDDSNFSVWIQESTSPSVQSNPEDGGSSIFESMGGNSNPNSSVWIGPQESTTLTVQNDSGNGSSSSDGSMGEGNSNSFSWFQPQGFTTPSVQVDSGNVSSSSDGNMGGASSDMNGGGAGDSNSSLGIQPQGSTTLPVQGISENGSSSSDGNMGDSPSGMSDGDVGNLNSSMWNQPQGSTIPSVQGNPGNGGGFPNTGSMGGGSLLSTIGGGGGNLVPNSPSNGGMGAVESTNSLPPSCSIGELGKLVCRNSPVTSLQQNTAPTTISGPVGSSSDNPPVLSQNGTVTNI